MDEESRAVFLEALRDGVAALDLQLTDAQLDACVRYTDLLLQTNAHTNLTRITEPAAVAVKHFVDSLALLTACPDLPQGASVADVGTGAGFPGIPLKIARPDLRFHLVDALQKRLTFLAEVVTALGLTDVAMVHARAEDVGRDPAHRDAHDVVVARAVAGLPTLLEWCAPLVRVGGRFVAMKGANVDDEIADSLGAQKALNVRLAADTRLHLPATGDDPEPPLRRLLVFEKLRPTPARFPRRAAETKGKPL